MRIIPGLTIFYKYPRTKLLALAWWHSPHSLTWRWTVDASWGLSRRVSAGVHKNPNGSGSWHVWLFVLGLNGSWQQPMWFRDLYVRMRDEEDIRNGMMWVSKRHPLAHLVPTPAPPRPTAHGTSTVQ